MLALVFGVFGPVGQGTPSVRSAPVGGAIMFSVQAVVALTWSGPLGHGDPQGDCETGPRDTRYTLTRAGALGRIEQVALTRRSADF